MEFSIHPLNNTNAAIAVYSILLILSRDIFNNFAFVPFGPEHAIQMVPTGFSEVPPPGPAIPLDASDQVTFNFFRTLSAIMVTTSFSSNR